MGNDPDMEKRALEEKYCDPTVREPFIAALTQVDLLNAYPPRPDGHGYLLTVSTSLVLSEAQAE